MKDLSKFPTSNLPGEGFNPNQCLSETFSIVLPLQFPFEYFGNVTLLVNDIPSIRLEIGQPYGSPKSYPTMTKKQTKKFGDVLANASESRLSDFVDVRYCKSTNPCVRHRSNHSETLPTEYVLVLPNHFRSRKRKDVLFTYSCGSYTNDVPARSACRAATNIEQACAISPLIHTPPYPCYIQSIEPLNKNRTA